MIMIRTGMILAAVLALALLSASSALGKDITKAQAESQRKAGQTANAKEPAAPKQLQEPAEKRQTEPKVKPLTPKDEKSATEIIQEERQQVEPLSAPAVDDKGRQIKWQIVCTGGNCGNSNILFGFGVQEFFNLCGTVGQVAVGQGTSPSFGVNQGFWQESHEDYICGDVNGGGAVEAGDVVYLIGYLFRGGPAPQPMCIGDANCSGMVEAGDVVYLIGYLFRGEEPPCPECCSSFHVSWGR
jgi:hypothetical protein